MYSKKYRDKDQIYVGDKELHLLCTETKTYTGADEHEDLQQFQKKEVDPTLLSSPREESTWLMHHGVHIRFQSKLASVF